MGLKCAQKDQNWGIYIGTLSQNKYLQIWVILHSIISQGPFYESISLALGKYTTAICGPLGGPEYVLNKGGGGVPKLGQD